MKNVQVVDGAENCIFPVYSISDKDFAQLFPRVGQNIEFVQDLAKRLGGSRSAGEFVTRITARRTNKRKVRGIHGTLFIDLPARSRYFPTKREEDVFVP